MTRINCVPPTILTVKHLVAEYRELPRVFGLVRQAQEKGLVVSDIDIPSNYVLGKGHVKFFYNKLLYLLDRQISLINEMKSRGYNPFHDKPDGLIEGLDRMWLNNWLPNESDHAINMARLIERGHNG